MRDSNELRLMALETVVGELVRRLSPAGFRETTMNAMDRCVGSCGELSTEEREDFAAFRGHVHEILYGKPRDRTAEHAAEPSAPPPWKTPVMQAIGKTAGRR